VDAHGDGYADVLLGSNGTSSSRPESAGAASLYYGGPSGLAETPGKSWEGHLPDGLIGAVAGCADLDGDGSDEVILAREATDARRSLRIEIHRGGSAGPSTEPTWTLVGVQPLRLNAGTVGDLNGDGHLDVIVGDWFWNSPRFQWAGRLAVIHGTGTGLGRTTFLNGRSTIDYYGGLVSTAGY
jgi:hypothetical protein